MSSFKDIQDADESPTKNVAWAENTSTKDPETPDDLGSGASSSSSSTTTASRGLSLVKNVPFVGRLASWWNDSAQPAQNLSRSSSTLQDSKRSAIHDLDGLTMAELIDKLEYRNEPRLSSMNPTGKGEDRPIAGDDTKAKTEALSPSYRNNNVFVRSDTQGQMQELRIEMEIAQAKLCWINRDYKKMVSCSSKALELSEKIGYIEYAAKVCFYVAIAYFGTNDFANGWRYLKHAEKCKGVFKEGDMIDWARKEGALFEKRAKKKGVLHSKQRADALMKNSSAASTPVTAHIPGKAWQVPRKLKSMSPSPGADIPTRGGNNNQNRHGKKTRETVSPPPNITSLDDEIEILDEHGVKTANN